MKQGSVNKGPYRGVSWDSAGAQGIQEERFAAALGQGAGASERTLSGIPRHSELYRNYESILGYSSVKDWVGVIAGAEGIQKERPAAAPGQGAKAM